MSLRFLFLYILLSVSYFVFPQEDIKLILTKKYAENSLRYGDYEFALENYLILYKLNKEDININYKIGICYTETTIDKSKAIPYLEFVTSHNNFPAKAYYYLGRSYMYNYRFTQAVDAFYDYKMIGVDENVINESDRLIQMCYDALERINVPRNVTFELLDSTVNSSFNDYYPFVDSKNTTLLFSSDRTYIEEYEDYIANVFLSTNKGKWSKAKSLSTNTYDKDEIVGMTPNGDKILIYTDGDYSTKDIKIVVRKGNKYSNLSKNNFVSKINTEGVEMGACLSSDGNILYFASDRKGGRGGLDIYKIQKDESGNWSNPENLGSTINTVYDENFPSLSINGKKMYFASKGHSGIGEYDIYESSYIDSLKVWTTPLNLGSPINTPEDNTTISFTEDGKSAYIAANRKEGYGKLDIYKITFGDENKSVIVMVTVMVGTENNSVPYSEDFLKAYGTFYDKYGNVIAQLPVESEGNFFGTLFPGIYKLDVRFEGYDKGYTETIEITEDKVGDFISRTVYLQQ